MQKYRLLIIVGLGLAASAVYLVVAKPVVAAQNEQSSVVSPNIITYTSSRKTLMPI